MAKLIPVGFAAGLLLAGCATAPTGTAPTSTAPIRRAPTGAAPIGRALSIDSSVKEIVANPAGKAVLEKDLPGITTDPSYDLFKGMSLKQMAPMSQGRLSAAVLKGIAKDLAAIPR